MKLLKGLIAAAFLIGLPALLLGCGGSDCNSCSATWEAPAAAGVVLRGSVFTDTGAPAAGAAVDMLRTGSALPLQGTAAADGSFVLTSLEKDAAYTLTVTYEGYLTHTGQVTMDASKTLDPIALQPVPVEQVYAVAGRILLSSSDSAVDPAAVTVRLIPVNADGPVCETGPDALGGYVFSGVAPGVYRVQVTVPGGCGVEDELQVTVSDRDVTVDGIFAVPAF